MLPAGQLQELLRFAVIDQRFFEFDADAVQRAVRAEQQRAGGTFNIFDGGTTVIRVRTGDKEHEVSYYALTYYARIYPAVPDLGRLVAIETKLQGIADSLGRGVRERVNMALDQANQAIKEQRPELPALVLADYRRTVLSEGGRRTVEFGRALAGGEALSVVVETAPDGETRTTVRIVPALTPR
jgi:hypothetical protein